MLSIVIPTHNEENYLPILLGCLKRQTFRDFEVIVADANSKDATKKIASNFGCKVVKGGMPSVGRNAGTKQAKGEWLLFLDADVQLENDFIKKSLAEIRKRKIDAGGCKIVPISSNIIDKIYFGIYNAWCLLTQFFFPHSTGSAIFCRKKIHNIANGFDETIIFAEDMDYVNRCSKIGRFRYLNNVEVDLSMRRYEKDGRLNVGLKILGAGLYRIFVGEIRTDLFKYKLKYKK